MLKFNAVPLVTFFHLISFCYLTHKIYKKQKNNRQLNFSKEKKIQNQQDTLRKFPRVAAHNFKLCALHKNVNMTLMNRLWISIWIWQPFTIWLFSLPSLKRCMEKLCTRKIKRRSVFLKINKNILCLLNKKRHWNHSEV